MIKEIRKALDGTYERQARCNAVAGLTAGLLLGAIAGLLFAPKSGKETRADLREGAKVGADMVKEAAGQVGEFAKEKADAVKDKISQMKAQKHAEAEADDADEEEADEEEKED